VLWNPAHFHPLAVSILEAHSGQPIPLSAAEFLPQELPRNLMSTGPEQLFPHARDAKAALSGLLLIAGHWEASHQIAQDVSSHEGSYWHAIVHRIEPDSSNAGYWFRQVGGHPIFAALREQATGLLAASNVDWRLKTLWDPQDFVSWSDEARRAPGGPKYACAQNIQGAECDLLFSWCAWEGMDIVK
jgi:hypothetical protein